MKKVILVLYGSGKFKLGDIRCIVRCYGYFLGVGYMLEIKFNDFR